MAGPSAGIAMLFKIGGTSVAGLQSCEVSFGATKIDISSADDAGWNTALAAAATGKTISVSVEGVEKDSVLYNKFNAGTDLLLTDVTVTLPFAGTTKDVLGGNFFLDSYTVTGSFDGAIMFKASLSSSGAPTYA